MQIQIQARGFTLTPGLISHIEHRLLRSLAHIRDDIKKVAVRISDINGPRHGIDKRCIVQVSLHGHKEVVVKDVHGDMYTAITHAASRVSHAVKKFAGKRRCKQRATDEIREETETIL